MDLSQIATVENVAFDEMISLNEPAIYNPSIKIGSYQSNSYGGNRRQADLPDLEYKFSVKAEEVDYLIPHQANQRIIEAMQSRLGYDDSKVISNIQYYGNTSAASIPIALAESVEKGKVKLGSTAILCGFGAGMTWGAAIVRLREGIC